MTSFETFDTMAGSERGIEQVTPLIQKLARAVLMGDTGDRGPEVKPAETGADRPRDSLFA